VPLHNAIVLETPDPQEIEANVIYLAEHPSESERIRREGRQTARHYTWEKVLKILLQKLEYQARIQGILIPEKRSPLPVQEAPIYLEAISRPDLQLAGSRQKSVVEI
jgi:hypothetical protein